MINMKRWNIKGFYGEYGYLMLNNDETATLELISGNHLYHKDYKTLKAAKIALGKMCDSYELKDVSNLLNV